MTSVREIQTSDIDLIVHYWLDADHDYLKGMGVDVSKLPARKQLHEMLMKQINSNYQEKNAYCIIWELDGEPVGHSNTNPTYFGKEATMHLHLWKPAIRKKGLGTAFLKMTIPFFFKNLKIKKLFCEPYALNPAPHKALQKIGFELVKEYTTIPGSMNFEQPVKQWVLSDEKYRALFNDNF